LSVDIGIIGLPKSGKTTIFNALTRGKASTTGQAPNIGIAKVPDRRLDNLVTMHQPRRVAPAEVRYVDIGAAARSGGKEPGFTGELLTRLSQVDALAAVIPAFYEDEGAVAIMRQVADNDMELNFSDLGIIERRLTRLEQSLKAAKQAERAGLKREEELLTRLKAGLEQERPIREQELSEEESKLVSGYQFLSAKPLLVIVNINETAAAETAATQAGLKADFDRAGRRLIVLAGKLEMELGELEEAEAADFRADMGLGGESGLEAVIRASYDLLGLITFFTTGEDECKAWPIAAGTVAVNAAGKIHSDIERGFIRAEVVHYDDLMRCGSTAEARRAGLLRQEGKTYTVRDGDIIVFLFNI
jgi:ribosome-binding ATPase